MILAIALHKGGVGKTTVAVNLAAALVETGRRVLVVDLDPQANASLALGAVVAGDTLHVGEVLLHRRAPMDLIRHGPGGVDILPAGGQLQLVAEKLNRDYFKQEHLAQELGRLSGYDAVLLDCPPSLDVLTANAIFAATRLIIPFPLDPFAYAGLADLLTLVNSVRRKPLTFSLLMSQYAEGRKLNAVMLEQLEPWATQILSTRIPHCEAPIRRAHGAQMPLLTYDTNATASVAFRALAKEILAKEEDAHHVAA